VLPGSGILLAALGLGIGPAEPPSRPAAPVSTSDASDAPDPSDAGASAVDSDDTSAAEQAALDAETVLTDNGMAYLEARARLVEHPKAATEALLDRLAVVPAPGPAQRKRILDVLAQLGRPELVPMFAAELRRAIAQAPSHRSAMEALERWRPLLFAQGEAALSAIQALVGDRDLPMQVRAHLLDDWVEITATADLGELIVLVGRGQVELRQQLHRALNRRATRDSAARDIMLRGTDEAIDAAAADPEEASRFAALLQLRASLSGEVDRSFIARLRELGEDDSAAFATRVAAVRGLAYFDHDNARAALTQVARAELRHLDSQAGEVLAWLALDNLPDAVAGQLAAEHELLDDDRPRLATVAFRVAPLANESWLETSLANPWPQVRQAALGRVHGPCGRKNVALLRDTAGPRPRGGDDDRRVARAAVQALGRCTPQEARGALERLMNREEVDTEQRIEAARQLVRHGGPDGVDAVAKALAGDPPRNLARRFAATLRFAPAPTPAATQALCARLGEANEVSRVARQSLTTLHPDGAYCNE
jgi:hypothetical protein